MILPQIKTSPQRPKNILFKQSILIGRNEIRRKHPALNSNFEKYFVISPFIPNKLSSYRSTKRPFKSPIKVAEKYNKYKILNSSANHLGENKESRTYSPKILNIVSPINLQARLRQSPKLKSLSPAGFLSDNSAICLKPLPKRRFIERLTPSPFHHTPNKNSMDSNIDEDAINMYPNYL